MPRMEACLGDTWHLLDPQEGKNGQRSLLRCGYEILVAHPVTLLRISFLECHYPLDSVQPVASDGGHVVAWVPCGERLESVILQAPRACLNSRCNHVHAMPVQADEPRIRIHLGEQPGVPERVRRFVTPPPLAETTQVMAEGAIDRRTQRGDYLRLVRRQFRAVGPGPLEDRPEVRELPAYLADMGFRRTGEVRMAVQDKPEQGGPGSARGQHEDRRLGWIVRYSRSFHTSSMPGASPGVIRGRTASSVPVLCGGCGLCKGFCHARMPLFRGARGALR